MSTPTITWRLSATVKKKRNWFVSCCPALEVCSQGMTEKKALKNLREALELFLVSCFERGTLEAVLKESGFVPTRAPVKASAQKKPSRPWFEIDIPIPFSIKPPKHHQSCPV